MLANPYKILYRTGNTLTIRYPQEIVRQHHRTHGDNCPFLPDMRVGMIVEHIENRPAIVVQRLLSGGGYNITLEWLPAPACGASESRLIEQEELQAWCAEHAGQAMADIVDKCPPCLDYYPEADIDGILTGEIVHAQDDHYQMFQNDDRTQCVVRKN